MRIYVGMHKKGHTLVEMLVYIGILSMTTVLVVNLIIFMARSFFNFVVTRDLSSGAQVGIERIVRDIRRADSIDISTSIFNASPGRLSLNTTDQYSGSTTTIEFFVDAGQFVIKEGAGSPVTLTPSTVSVDELIFRRIVASTTEAVKVEFEITASIGSVTRTERFYTTGVLRKDY